MPITYTSSSATVSTSEYSLPANTTSGVPTAATAEGVYQFVIDFADMVAGDQYSVKIYEKADSSFTQRIVEEWIFSGAQSKPLFFSPTFVLGKGWDLTALRLAGADKKLYWSIRKIS